MFPGHLYVIIVFPPVNMIITYGNMPHNVIISNLVSVKVISHCPPNISKKENERYNESEAMSTREVIV